MSNQGAIVMENKVVSIGSVKLVKNIERYYDVVEIVDIFISPFSNENIIKVKSLLGKRLPYNITPNEILGNVVQLEDDFYEYFKKY